MYVLCMYYVCMYVCISIQLKKTLSALIEGLHPELKMKKSLAQTADEVGVQKHV